jgi:hypothetical protein
MYDHLSRREALRVAVVCLLWASAGVLSAGFCAWGFLASLGPALVPDVVKAARAGALLLGAFCCWFSFASIGDCLRSAAFLSFARSLSRRAGR